VEERILVIENGTVIDGTGKSAERKERVVVKGTRIVFVGSGIEIPSGAEIIDARGKTVMPGLMDCHVHLGVVEPRYDPFNPTYSNWLMALTRAPPALRVLYAVKQAYDTLAAGFTTVRHGGHYLSPPDVVSLKRGIELGLVRGPRVIAGNIITATAGLFDIVYPSTWRRGPDGVERTYAIADGTWEVRKKVRELVRDGTDIVKTAVGGGAVVEPEQEAWRNYTLDELEAIVDEAHAFGKKVMCHCFGPPGTKNAIRAGVDTLEHGKMLDDEDIQNMLKRKIILVPTFSPYSPRNIETNRRAGLPEYFLEALSSVTVTHRETFKKAHHAGVKIACGSDITGKYTPFHGENAGELVDMVDNGMSEMEAIIAATKNSAEACNVEKYVGTIEAGKLADILIVNGDPLSDIHILTDKEKIQVVMQSGKIAIDRRN